jgi:hypothetical protein
MKSSCSTFSLRLIVKLVSLQVLRWGFEHLVVANGQTMTERLLTKQKFDVSYDYKCDLRSKLKQ